MESTKNIRQWNKKASRRHAKVVLFVLLRSWPLTVQVSLLRQSHSFAPFGMPRFGRDQGLLSFEVGRMCALGEGVYYLATIHMMDIFDVISRATGSA